MKINFRFYRNNTSAKIMIKLFPFVTTVYFFEHFYFPFINIGINPFAI